jgi:hypothetical protein
MIRAVAVVLALLVQMLRLRLVVRVVQVWQAV